MIAADVGSTLNRQPSILDSLTGWWNGVTTGDFDEDGQMDIVATHWELNTPYEASAKRPLRLYYGDLMSPGVLDLSESEYDSSRQAFVPRHSLDFMASGLPFLREQFPAFRAFSEALIDDALGDLRSRAFSVEVTTLRSKTSLPSRDCAWS